MNIDAHKRALKESMDEIRSAISIGIDRRQRTIGFHCSAAAIDLLEIYLHEQNLISPGTSIKHDFFASEKKSKSRLPEFPKKAKVLSLLIYLESKRNTLTYGKAQSRDVIEKYIETFNSIVEIFEDLGVEHE
jgi:hypothetical protein